MTRTKISTRERVDWRESLRQIKEDTWGRPAAAGWGQLGSTRNPLDFVTDGDEVKGMQAYLVAVDHTVAVGERGQLLHQNTLFDALALRWSQSYAAALNPARISYDMSEDAIKKSWRELSLEGLSCEALWDAVLEGLPGLYSVERVNPHRRKGVKGRRGDSGYHVTVHDPSRLKDALTGTAYRRASGRSRLLVADAVEPVAEIERTDPDAADDVEARGETRMRVAAGWRYMTAETSARSREVIGILEGARQNLNVAALHLDVRNIVSEFELEKAKQRPSHRSAAYMKALGHVNALKAIDATVSRLGAETIEIRSRVAKLVNGRYQYLDFSPAEASSKDAMAYRVADDVWAEMPARSRWFEVAPTSLDGLPWPDGRRPLVGVDIKSSQYQIQAVFTGRDDIEPTLRENGFKKPAVALAWLKHNDSTDIFKLPVPWESHDRPRLLENAVKQAGLTYGYGSTPYVIAEKLKASPEEFGLLGLGSPQNVEEFLGDKRLPIAREILEAGKRIAEVAYERDRFAGACLPNPFDGTIHRWNPIRRQLRRVAGRDKFRVWASLPVEAAGPTGDYPVDLEKLKRMVAPCLTHMLDATFASFVILGLHSRGIRDIVNIHDGWAVAADAEQQLYDAVDAAGEPWLRSLGPMYDAILDYLFGTDLAQKAEEWREKWRQRVDREDWPKFGRDDSGLLRLFRLEDGYMNEVTLREQLEKERDQMANDQHLRGADRDDADRNSFHGRESA